MLGALAGDIIGSVYEFHNTWSTDFDLFTPWSKFTDDTVMTLAVAKWLVEDDAHTIHYLIYCMQELGQRYPKAGYGGNFDWWLRQDNPQPYNSWGNGSAMRVSPVGLYAKTLDEALALAALTASVSHNHPEGVKGAQAIATSVFLCKQGKPKQEIKAMAGAIAACMYLIPDEIAERCNNILTDDLRDIKDRFIEFVENRPE